VSIPKNFPRQRNADYVSVDILGRFSRESLRKVDFAGFLLMISFTLLLVTTLLEVGTVFQWKSPVPIVLLILSALCLVAFLTWERHITGDQSQQQPLFPWRYFYNRPWMGIIMYVKIHLFSGLFGSFLTNHIAHHFWSASLSM